MTTDTLNIFHVSEIPTGETEKSFLPNQCLVKNLTEAVFYHGLSSANLQHYNCAPGELNVCHRQMDQWVRWESTVAMLMVEFPDAVFRVIAEETGSNVVELIGTCRFVDGRVTALFSALEAERVSGYPAGRLYLDAVGQAMASALVTAQGILRRPLKQRVGGLAPYQLRRVIEYIHAEFTRDISLFEMAQVAGLSTQYFAVMFRKSAGLAPHQFLLRTRVERAQTLLEQRNLSIHDVAVASGFRTQQHFARVFRDWTRVTPSQYRLSCIKMEAM